MKIALCPGSYDPVTNGHLDIIGRAAQIFDQVVVLVVQNRAKTPTFSLEERAQMIRRSVKKMPNVRVDCSCGLVVDYARQHDIHVMVKGLRAVTDFEDEFQQALINRIIENRKRGKKHNIIINAEGIGHSGSMAKRIEAATGIETRATILGHMQRGGTPTCKDRVYASIMGARAAELLAEGKSNRLVAYKHGEFVDYDIQEALNMKKDIPEEQYEIAKLLAR